MPPVWGQSATCRITYARFTEELSVFLARGSCRGDEWMSIDKTVLVSIDSDARTWAKHILRPIEAHKPHKVSKIPTDDQKPFVCIYKPLLMATSFHYLILLFSLRFGENINSPSEIYWNSIGFIIDFVSIILFTLWFILLILCLSNHLVRFRDFMSLMSNWW